MYIYIFDVYMQIIIFLLLFWWKFYKLRLDKLGLEVHVRSRGDMMETKTEKKKWEGKGRGNKFFILARTDHRKKKKKKD